MIKYLKISISLLFALVSFQVLALDPTYTSLFSSKAIKGYDTVAYFTEGKPVEGNSEFTTQYNEATWLFSSQKNLDLFLANPEKYAPQYGGYCAYAVSQGQTAPIKPELFTIHEGKLYLNYSESINERWLKNKEAFIVDADQNWPKLLSE